MRQQGVLNMKFPYPNAIFVTYSGFRYSNSLTEVRNTFTAKTSEGILEFKGTRTEATDFFRDKFPSKSIVFRQELWN
jgi:hypothetical protein